MIVGLWAGRSATAEAEVAVPAPDAGQTASCDVFQGLINQALRTHPVIQARYQGLEASRAEVSLARWQFYPSISVGLQRVRDGASAGANSSGANLSVQQALWSGGRLQANMDAALRKQNLAEAGATESQRDIALKVADAWSAWLAATGRRLATEAAMAKLEQLDAMIRRRVDQQVSAMVDAQLMAVRLQQARSERLSASVAQDVALQRLTQWVGRSDWAHAMGSAELIQCQRSLLKAAEIPSDGSSWVDQQPALTRLKAEVALTAAEVEQRRAERWPTLFARFERQATENAFGIAGGMASKWTVGLQYSPGAGLTTLDAVRVPLARHQALELEVQGLQREWQQRIDSDLLEFRGNQQKLVLLEEVRTGNQTLANAYTRLFVAGRRSWLEVLNVVREVAQSEIAASDLLAAQVGLLHRLELYRMPMVPSPPTGGTP